MQQKLVAHLAVYLSSVQKYLQLYTGSDLGMRYGVDQKKVNLVLDQLERCGFLHGVQHVSKNTSTVIVDIAKF